MSSNKFSRRMFLDAALAAGAATASGVLIPGCGSSADESNPGGSKKKGPGGKVDDPNAAPYRAVVAGFSDQATRRTSVERVVEMLGGMPWLKPGDRVLIKPAHNSMNPYPFTASGMSAGELARLCLEAGASKVVVADCMGIEHTLVPGGWHLESPYTDGSVFGFDPDNDATVLAMKNSGFYSGVVDTIGAGDVGPDRKVQITSFHELGWRRYESRADTPGTPRMLASWVRDQLKNAINWDGDLESRIYLPRRFDFLRSEVPGMMLPRVLDEVDHVINLHRVSTHIWSHATHSLKNWIGVQRPDERVWMHQLNYLKNRRHAPDDPASSEMPYHEFLAELHMATWKREKLIIADATDVVLSGGPDATDKPYYPARLMMGARDLISADVVAMSIVKMGVLAALTEGGLDALCALQPHSNTELFFAFVGQALKWRDGPFAGTDAKLCDATFSPWDWLAIRRARELGLGPVDPSKLGVLYADGDHAVPEDKAAFIDGEVYNWPTYDLQAP